MTGAFFSLVGEPGSDEGFVRPPGRSGGKCGFSKLGPEGSGTFSWLWLMSFATVGLLGGLPERLYLEEALKMTARATSFLGDVGGGSESFGMVEDMGFAIGIGGGGGGDPPLASDGLLERAGLFGGIGGISAVAVDPMSASTEDDLLISNALG